MSRCCFFGGVIEKVYFDQWLGDLFFRRVTPDEIEAMPFHRLKYWGGWCDKMRQAEKDAVKKKPGGKK